MKWILKHPRATYEMLGFIPAMLSETSPANAREQLHAGYAHGGGWQPFPRHIGRTGFKLLPNGTIKYPGDPALHCIAETTLRDETIRLYEHAWVMILQPDGSFEISRMD